MSPDVAVTATARLHKDGDDDEPLEIDQDVSVRCDCGTTSTERDQVYKEADSVHVVCDGCGAEWAVAITTVLAFTAVPSKESPSVL